MTTSTFRRVPLFTAVGLAALTMGASLASATEGYFQLGFGPRQSAMGGTGVANSVDAMAQALNPAGIAGLDKQWQLGAAAFMPYRGYDGTGTGLVTSGSVESDSNFFVVPNAAYIRPIDEDSTFGLVLYGNGGMNTNYSANYNCTPGAPGVFCGMGKTGVDMMQAFLSATYARRMGPVKIGIAPTVVAHRFRGLGLSAFAPMSSDAAHLTNNGYDYALGAGLRGGVEFDLAENLRIGVAGQTKMWMSKFSKYRGLFAEQGDFDIPAAITAGISFDATPDLTLNFDYQHIFYEGVKAVSNGFPAGGPLGADNGPGFGWEDVDVFKVGAEWKASDDWTLRAGYAYVTSPIKSDDVTLNILAPGVVQHHITAGAAYKMSDTGTLEFFGMVVPASHVKGPEVTPFGATPGSTVDLNMHQFQFGFGYTKKF